MRTDGQNLILWHFDSEIPRLWDIHFCLLEITQPWVFSYGNTKCDNVSSEQINIHPLYQDTDMILTRKQIRIRGKTQKSIYALVTPVCIFIHTYTCLAIQIICMIFIYTIIICIQININQIVLIIKKVNK